MDDRKRRRVVFLVSMLAFAVAVCADSGYAKTTALEYKKAQGPMQVTVVEYQWRDDKRSREVPVKIYYPATGAGPFPVVIFSHGLGGNRNAAEYLGRHWASHGYVSVHPQHKGSDSEIFQNGKPATEVMKKTVRDVTNAINRPKDVSFVADRLEKLNQENGALKGRLDLKRLGVAGHSFGAFTTLAIAGEVFIGPNGGELSFPDPRFKAAIPLSSPVSRPQRENAKRAFTKITIPCLHMTGTEDHSPIGETRVEDRRLPYDYSNTSDQFLIIFKGGDHPIFAGPRPRNPKEIDPRAHDLIRMSTTAFLDAYLRGDKAAMAWLVNGGLGGALGSDGTFEKKIKK